MKVKPSVKKICDKCKVIRRHGNVMVICDTRGNKPHSITLSTPTWVTLGSEAEAGLLARTER